MRISMSKAPYPRLKTMTDLTLEYDSRTDEVFYKSYPTDAWGCMGRKNFEAQYSAIPELYTTITIGGKSMASDKIPTTETKPAPKHKKPKGWEAAEFAMVNKLDRLLLYGKPGTGKTYFALNYFLPPSGQSFRLICTDEMTDGDLVGTYRQSDNGIWKFHEGFAIKAWRVGGRLVVDEINRCNGDVESRLMALIDTVASSSFQNPETGEVVTPQDGYSVVATMNGEPDDLSPAVLDRLVVRAEINEPHPDAIKALPLYLRDIAMAYCSKDDKDRYSIRSFIAFNQLYKASGDMEKAAHVCIPNISGSVLDAMRLLDSEKQVMAKASA